jgi:hypothetical protein
VRDESGGNGVKGTRIRCAIYTRKSTEEGLDQDFNSLDAQREAAEAYIKSQKHLGWTLVPGRYDDGGFSGSSLERPALQKSAEPSLSFSQIGANHTRTSRSRKRPK